MDDDLAIDYAVMNEMRPLEITKEGKDTRLTGVFFGSVLKEKATDPEPWSYIESGERVSFAPRELRWSDGQVIKAAPDEATGSIDKTDMSYKDVFGAGISVKITQNNYVWRKIVEVSSLAALGELPEDGYLEIKFDLGGNVVLPEGPITKALCFGKKSQLRMIGAWDLDKNWIADVSGEIKDRILTKRISVKELKEAAYPLYIDTTITYGTQNCFTSGITGANHSSVTKLDTTHFVVAYRSVSAFLMYGFCVAGSISGTTITYGTPTAISPLNEGYFTSVVALDSTHFVVTCTGSGQGIARVGSVSGTTITLGGINSFASATVFDTSVTALDSTHFVVAAVDSNARGFARVGLVSGTTISSYGTGVQFNAVATIHVSVAALDSTHFVVAYKDDGGSDYGCARIGLVSGTTISSYGTENCFNSAITDYISVAALDSTHFVVAYKDDGGSDYGCARIGLVSGTTILSYGTENCFNSADTIDISIDTFDNLSFVVAYHDEGGSNDGCARIGLVSGTTILSYGTENCYISNPEENANAVATLDDNVFVAVYGLINGCAKIGTFPVQFTPQITVM